MVRRVAAIMIISLVCFSQWLPAPTAAVAGEYSRSITPQAQLIDNFARSAPAEPAGEAAQLKVSDSTQSVTSTVSLADEQIPAWVNTYSSPEAQQQLPPWQPVYEGSPDGPSMPLGGWSVQVSAPGTKSVVAMQTVPDGRLFVAIDGGGVQVYAPNAQGDYVWSTITASPGGLVTNNVTDLAYLFGELWISTDSGISIYQIYLNTWRQINSGNSWRIVAV